MAGEAGELERRVAERERPNLHIASKLIDDIDETALDEQLWQRDIWLDRAQELVGRLLRSIAGMGRE